MKLGLLGDALLLWRWKLLLLWNGLLSSAVEATSAMGSKMLYGRGMPRPNSMPFFFGG